ncbi:MAG: YebC/PmpR family DNA-binding transcriptional regulator [bacterium]|nr:YebC/PmpR family DNA-binding transcriptional regulator [bacterium]
MSGHSKWHSIKHKKGAADAKRGKIFTKHAKLIAVAARSGGDPDMNPSLRSAIDNAKSDNVPNSNIEKAVKKGSGDDKDSAAFEEVMYEGYGPEGTAMLIEVITDNKNRSLTNVKIIMQKTGGRMAEAGSVAWLFNRKGVITAKAGDLDKDEAELIAIDAGAEDLSVEDDEFEIITADTDLMNVRNSLVEAGFKIGKSDLAYLPKNIVEIDNADKAEKVLRLIDALEDDDDVSRVHSNFDIPDEVMENIG